jgi:hypothetical protein
LAVTVIPNDEGWLTPKEELFIFFYFVKLLHDCWKIFVLSDSFSLDFENRLLQTLKTFDLEEVPGLLTLRLIKDLDPFNLFSDCLVLILSLFVGIKSSALSSLLRARQDLEFFVFSSRVTFG